MTRHYRRRRPGLRETVTAAALAAGAAAVTFYFTRILISRESLGAAPGDRSPPGPLRPLPEDRSASPTGEGAHGDP